MSATKSALDKLIESTSSHWPTLTPKARVELAQLRADLQAAQERSAEQARQIYQAREIMEELSGVSVRQQLPRINAWLAANPAPSAEPQP